MLARLMKAARTAGIVLTVLGGVVGLWVITRLSNAAGQSYMWVPPFAPYEWLTLAGAAVAAACLIAGLLRLTGPRERQPVTSAKHEQEPHDVQPINHP